MDLEGEQLPVRRRRRRRVLPTLLLLLIVALAGLWLARKPLATRYADRFLAKKGVPARYGIADLGLGRQRLVNVVLGDPADPDLVADWLEARTAIGLHGPYLTGVRGGHVRVRARLVDGRLSLGSIDRLLPAGESGKPFALPALSLDVQDLRARVETPWGLIGAKLSGSGRLDGGFDGRLAVTSARLDTGCRVTAPRALARVRTLGAGLLRAAMAVRLDGSAEVTGLACGDAATGFANLNGGGEVTLGDAPRWTGRADLAATDLRHPQGRAGALAGSVQLAGDARLTTGRVDLRAERWSSSGASGRRLAVVAPVAINPEGFSLGDRRGGARVTAEAARVDPAMLRRFATLGEAAPGTPLAPLLAQLADAIRRAGNGFDATATGSLLVNGVTGAVRVDGASARAASGAEGRWSGLAVSSGGGEEGTGIELDGALAVDGGGLPRLDARLTQHDPGRLTGTAMIAPFAANGARIALEPVAFDLAGGRWHATTTATLSGPLADGRVDGLRLPVDARGDGRGGVMVGPACAPVGWQRIAVAGLVLDPGGVRLCPTAGALVSVRNGSVGGGASLGTTRLTGRLGTTPLTLAATGARATLGDRGFTIQGIAARLGQPERLTRLDIATLDGRATPQGLAGRFAGAGGRIGAVPLVLSGAGGDWRLANGALTLGGALTVSDAQADHPRFRPLPASDVALTLADGRIAATGKLRAPAGGGTGGARLVADVRLTHDLAGGAGNARFTVPGLVFDRALQPDQLTPITFGVIADVRGTVTGEGAIDWTPAGVTSSGSFHTDDTALAAAFGPVEGIAGTIRFTDLLALESAPGQQFAIRSVNPGIAVTDGVVRFQTLANARVQVEGARWPFAGGTLTLEPTLLDFGQAAQRRMVFRVEGMAADQFLQQFDFKNLNTTGIFDGVLPMVFDESGGRIADGRLQVRPGGGTIAYVGPISQKDIGFWPNLAFQALKSLRYRDLSIVMNGPLAGEMVTEVRFAGVSQGEGAERGGIAGLLVRRLQRLPFLFNIRIKAPFRGLLDATASFYDPRRLIQRNLPALLDEQNRRAQPQGGNQAPPGGPSPPIQPPASETVP